MVVENSGDRLATIVAQKSLRAGVRGTTRAFVVRVVCRGLRDPTLGRAESTFVVRRYSDFHALHARLLELAPRGECVPPLPPKLISHSESAMTARVHGLNAFLSALGACSHVGFQAELDAFLSDLPAGKYATPPRAEHATAYGGLSEGNIYIQDSDL